MFSSDISSELKEILQRVTPKFEENLKRAFQNEGFRRQNHKGQKTMFHPLDDVLFTVGDNIINLKNLNLQRMPDFRITSLSVNFSMLSLSVALNLGDITITGDCEVHSKNLQHLLPITRTGKIEVTLHNVVAVGRIGLFIKDDSFVTEHYDLNYSPVYVTVIVSHKEEQSELRVENEIIKQHIDETIAITFWSELKEVITGLLHAQLETVIVEESISELLAESDVELRAHAHELALKGNRLFDSILCTAKGRIVAESARLLKTSRLDVIFKGKHPSQQQGSLEANEGYIQDLSTLSRSNDVSFYENEQEVVIYGSLNLREFKNGYQKYKSHYGKTYAEGSIRTTIYQNKIFLKLSLSKSDEHCPTQLESFQFRSVNDIDVVVSGLGSLTWLAKDIKSWIVGKLRNDVLPMLEKRISNAFQYAIEATDCAALLID